MMAVPKYGNPGEIIDHQGHAVYVGGLMDFDTESGKLLGILEAKGHSEGSEKSLSLAAEYPELIVNFFERKQDRLAIKYILMSATRHPENQDPHLVIGEKVRSGLEEAESISGNWSDVPLKLILKDAKATKGDKTKKWMKLNAPSETKQYGEMTVDRDLINFCYYKEGGDLMVESWSSPVIPRSQSEHASRGR